MIQLADNTDLTAQHVLDLCRLQPKVYAVSPFADRINFETQQIRTLNLVLSLFEAEELKPGDSVAVVGGGLAGLMACATLLHLGCVVHLFEKTGQYLSAQRQSSHRFIHPTFNFWPNEPLRFTTELPFLNWHADTCDRVIQQIIDEWEEIKTENQSRFKFLPQKYIKFVDVANGINIEVDRSQERDKRDIYTHLTPYKLAIKCTGFGRERRIAAKSCPGYWKPQHKRERNVVVVGSGDGGLIEAIIRIYGISMGRLVKIAQDIDQEKVSPDSLSLLASNPLQFAFEQTEMLERVLPSLRNHVTIVTNSKNIFQQQTAPIHRLLVAYAHTDQMATIYHSANLESAGKPRSYRIVQAGEPPACIDNAHVIERIGSADVKDEEKLRGNQQWVDYVRKTKWTDKGISQDRDNLFSKSTEAVFRWMDLNSIRKPHYIHIENRETTLSIQTIPGIGNLPGKLFGLELANSDDLDDGSTPYERVS